MARKAKPKHRRKNQPRLARRAAPRRRKVAAQRKPKRTRKVVLSTPLLEIAIREMNRGRSLTATARSLKLPSADLRKILRQRRLLKRKGKRWVITDDRLRRVPITTGGRTRNLILRGYEPARFVGEYHQAVREFLRTNDPKFLKPFRDRIVKAIDGREHVLETNPNALHRIAAMDSPPFHEIYEITSND